jgi:drug/metabolite transporter (DMT)-like permease
MRYRSSVNIDDADIAAGNLVPGSLRIPEAAPISLASLATINSCKGHPMDLEFFEDMVSEPVLVLGFDISHLNRRTQFVVCATGVTCFSLLYGYLQELIAVQLFNRNLGLFLAMIQFAGYTVLAHFLNVFVYKKRIRLDKKKKQLSRQHSRSLSPVSNDSLGSVVSSESSDSTDNTSQGNIIQPKKQYSVPLQLYLGLALLRALDLAMTNLAMQYINYPAKTLMKSSRVVFTMLFGVIISGKVYYLADYLIVVCMVAGLVIFMHADAHSSAVFHGTGVVMLVVSLLCDGAISNVSETIMSKFGVGQDEVRYWCGGDVILLWWMWCISQFNIFSICISSFSACTRLLSSPLPPQPASRATCAKASSG